MTKVSKKYELLNTSVEDVRVKLECALANGKPIEVLKSVTACFKNMNETGVQGKTRRKYLATAARRALKQLEC